MIDKYESGHLICIDGRDYHHDVKIIDGRVKGDWWRREGHRLDSRDITDILEMHPEVLVIGTGYAEQMRVPESTREAIASHGIQMKVEKTDRAVRTFNHLLKEGRVVAGAFHLTC